MHFCLKVGDLVKVWLRTSQEFQEFIAKQETNVVRRGSDHQPIAQWQKPLFSFLKLNYDASFDSKSCQAGIAVVGRDENGNLIYGFQSLTQAPSVEVTEVMAIREACLMIHFTSWSRVWVESDYLVHGLNDAGAPRRCETKAIEEDIVALVKDLSEVFFCFAVRDANRVPDWVQSRQERPAVLRIGWLTHLQVLRHSCSCWFLFLAQSRL